MPRSASRASRIHIEGHGCVAWAAGRGKQPEKASRGPGGLSPHVEERTRADEGLASVASSRNAFREHRDDAAVPVHEDGAASVEADDSQADGMIIIDDEP
jgi:hypothetical protein